MKKEVPAPLVFSIVAALIAGFILSHLLIKNPGSAAVTTIPTIPTSFPDVKNNHLYSNFLNSGALDPTQVVPIGNSQNNSPFNGT